MQCATMFHKRNACLYSCMYCTHKLKIVILITMFKYCSPVQDVADSCRTGAATNLILGLALGYKSAIIPIFATSIAIYLSFSLAAMYGIFVSALGMLSTIGGIAEMAGMSHEICERTDALDAAGNTTASFGKVIIFGSKLFD